MSSRKIRVPTITDIKQMSELNTVLRIVFSMQCDGVWHGTEGDWHEVRDRYWEVRGKHAAQASSAKIEEEFKRYLNGEDYNDERVIKIQIKQRFPDEVNLLTIVFQRQENGRWDNEESDWRKVARSHELKYGAGPFSVAFKVKDALKNLLLHKDLNDKRCIRQVYTKLNSDEIDEKETENKYQKENESEDDDNGILVEKDFFKEREFLFLNETEYTYSESLSAVAKDLVVKYGGKIKNRIRVGILKDTAIYPINFGSFNEKVADILRGGFQNDVYEPSLIFTSADNMQFADPKEHVYLSRDLFLAQNWNAGMCYSKDCPVHHRYLEAIQKVQKVGRRTAALQVQPESEEMFVKADFSCMCYYRYLFERKDVYVGECADGSPSTTDPLVKLDDLRVVVLKSQMELNTLKRERASIKSKLAGDLLTGKFHFEKIKHAFGHGSGENLHTDRSPLLELFTKSASAKVLTIIFAEQQFLMQTSKGSFDDEQFCKSVMMSEYVRMYGAVGVSKKSKTALWDFRPAFRAVWKLLKRELGETVMEKTFDQGFVKYMNNLFRKRRVSQ